VKLGTVVAPSRTLSTTQIQVIIPDGLHNGPVSITVTSRGLTTNPLTFTAAPPPTPDVLSGLNYNLDFTSLSYLGTTVKRAEMQLRAASGGDMIFPGTLNAFRGLFPTSFFSGLGLSSFAVNSSTTRGSLYATPVPGRTGVVKDSPVRDVSSSSTPVPVTAATTTGMATLSAGSVSYYTLPSGSTAPVYSPVYLPNSNFTTQTPAGPNNPLLKVGAWLQTSDAFVPVGAGASNYSTLPPAAGVAVAPPVPDRNPNFSITPNRTGSPQPFLDGTWIATEHGVVRVAGAGTTFISLPAGAGQPIGSPVAQSNPNFNPTYPASGPALGDPKPFESTLLVAVTNGLVSVYGGQAEFVSVPPEAGRVIAQPSSQLNPNFNFSPTASPTLDDVRLFLPVTLLVTENGLVDIDDTTVGFTPVPSGAGRVVSPAVAAINPDFNPFFSITPSGSPRPFLPTIYMTTTNGLVSIANGGASFTPMPTDAGQVISPPVFTLNASFNPTFNPGSPSGSPFPFGREILIGTTNGIVVVADGVTSLIPLPFGAGMPVGSPIPITTRGASTEILVPVTNGLVRITGGAPNFVPLPAGAGAVIGPPFINSAGQIFLAVKNGLVQVNGTATSFAVVPAQAGTVVSLPIPDPNSTSGTQFILTTTNGYATIAGTSVNYMSLPSNSGPNIAPRVLLTRVQVVNQPPVANAGPDRTVSPGTSVTFDGSASLDPDGVIVSYQWDFGDNTTASGQVVTHTYTNPGVFTVTLTVTDNDGAATSDTGVITVLDTTPPTVNLLAPVGGETIPAGSTFMIRWSSFDNVGVNSHDILLATDGVNFNTTIATNLSGFTQSFNWSVPGTLSTTSARIRVIARDAAGNAGQADSGLFTIRDAQPPSVAILAPSGGETVSAGSTFTIRWISSDNVGVTSHDILLAADGANFNATIASGLSGSTQQFNWFVPANLATTAARIRVIARDVAGNAGQADSNQFTVRDAQPPTVTIQSPVAGQVLSAGSTFTIRWTSTDNVGVTSQDILFSNDGVNFNTNIASGLSASAQQFNWSVPLTSNSSSARIRIIARDAAGNVGQADAGPFTIRDTQPPSVTIQSPTGGETIPAGGAFLIRWTSSDNLGVVSHDILLSTDGFNFNTAVASGLSGSTQQFNWSVPTITTSSSRLRIVARDGAGNVAQSDSGLFTIRDTTPPTVSIQAPAGGETLVPGSTFTIRWNSFDNVGVTAHDILLSTDGFNFNTTIASGLPGSAQQFNWSIPLNLATNTARIRVVARDAAGNTGLSDSGLFTIRDTIAPSVSVTAPTSGQVINAGSSFNVRWTSSDNVGVVSHDVLLSTDGGFNFSAVVASGLSGNQTSFLWSVPNNVATSQARIRVSARDAAGNVGQADSGNFTIRDTQPPSVTVVAPSAGQIISPGSVVAVTWNSSDNVGITSHDILLSTNGGANFNTTIVTGLGGGQQSFSWSVPTNINTTQARIRVRAVDAAGNVGLGDSGNFTIQDNTPPTVNLIQPSAGQTISPGTTFTIQWNSSDNVGVTSQDIQFSSNGGQTYSTIASGLSGSQQQFNWSVPIINTTQARIRVIARDAVGNQGQGETGNFTIRDTIPPTVTVQAPTAGQSISPGSLFTIQWTSSDNIGVDAQDVLLSTNGGGSYSTIVSGLPGNQQQYNWSVPTNINTTQARIRVVARDAAGNVGQGDTGNFTIRDSVPPAVSLIAPVGGESLSQGAQFTIQWSSSDNLAVTSHDVLLSTNGGSTFSTIASNLSGNQQSFTWNVPANVSTNQAQIRVVARDAAGNSGQATSGNFTIRDATPPSVSVTQPSAGQVINAGSQFTIRWTSSDNVAVTSQDIFLSTDSGNSFPTQIATNLSGGQQTFNWSVPSNLSTTQAVVRVMARDASGNAGQGDSGVFRIQPPPPPPTVTVLTPNGGETIMGGSTFNIQWTSSSNVGLASHDILLSTNSGQSFTTTIQTALPGSAQSFNWSVPNNLNTTRARVRVIARDTNGVAAQDDSNGDFTIQPGGGGGSGMPQFALVASGDLTILHKLPSQGSILGTIHVSGSAKEVAVAPNRQFALALTLGARVSVITGLTGPSPQESASLNVGVQPVGVAISDDSSFAVVLVDSTPVKLVPITGLPNNPVVGTPFMLTQVQSGAQDIAMSSLGTVVVTASSIGGVAIVDNIRTSPTFRGVQRTGLNPKGVAFTKDGTTAFVVNQGTDNVVAVTGVAPGGHLGFGSLVNPGSSPFGIDVSSDGSIAVVTSQGGNSATIYKVTGSMLTQVSVVSVGNRPGGISISGDGNSAIVANTGDQSISVITNLQGAPAVTSTIGSSSQLQTDEDREQSVAFVP
jgi:hypothetical protein